jgi:hypothetical protein
MSNANNNTANGNKTGTPTVVEGAKPKAEKKKKTLAELAEEVCEANGLDEVWGNDKGEFFSSHNLALLSVGGDSKKVKKYQAAAKKDTSSTGDGDQE